jgi:hypothetical protein
MHGKLCSGEPRHRNSKVGLSELCVSENFLNFMNLWFYNRQT